MDISALFSSKLSTSYSQLGYILWLIDWINICYIFSYSSFSYICTHAVKLNHEIFIYISLYLIGPSCIMFHTHNAFSCRCRQILDVRTQKKMYYIKYYSDNLSSYFKIWHHLESFIYEQKKIKYILKRKIMI